MAMNFVTIRGQSNQDAGGTVVIDRHLYLAEDRTRVVEEGDPASRWLWASPGTVVPRSEALRLGAITPDPEPAQQMDNSEVAETAEPEADSDAANGDEMVADKPKRGRPAANKGRKPGQDK